MADPDYRKPDEDDEEDDEIDETGYKTTKDAVLFAIDASASMLTRPTESDSKKPDTALSPTLAALKCAYALMQQRIISNPSDMMGILLFGTKKSRFQDGDGAGTGLQYPHCYLLTDLDVPAAADVKNLRNLVDDEEESKELLQASKTEVSMANVLFCANQIFTTKAPNFSSRRLFLVTDNDYPHASSRDARNSAAVRAKDLYDLGVTIELFPISHPHRGHTFDRSKFYNDIIYSSTPADPDAPAPLTADIKPASSTAKNGISLLQSLLTSVNSRAAPRRALVSNLPFEIGPGLKISVRAYIFLKRQEPKRTSYIYLPPDSEKAQIAVHSSSLMADDTARTVEKVEVRKAFKFGGETISFSAEELSKIKNYGDPVLRIIGFKPQSMLPVWANLKPATFIYPSEEEYIGSTRVFSALYQKLLSSKKMGLAWFIPRRNAAPVLAAILPGAERIDPDGAQSVPAGLWIKPLPFADDIRQPPEVHHVPAPDEVVDCMRTVVQQLQLPRGVYDPMKYPNPSLQWFYRILQALALEEDVPEKAVDLTLPKYRQIDKRAGPYVKEWGEKLDAAFLAWKQQNSAGQRVTSTGATKRAAKPAQSQTAGKNIKAEDGGDGDDGPSEADLRSAYEKDALKKLTVKDLKNFLHGKGLGKGVAKKDDLVDAVTRYFETKMEIG
ncbi:ATP-dependent DNA helicase II subunit 1 [Oleoguttula sp. CCFEE 5521]